MTSNPHRLRHLFVMIAAAATLTACGGDSDDTPPVAAAPAPGAPAAPTPPSQPPATPTSITGTAAVGLPLVGTVTVKDAAGATRQSPINNGSYTIDVSGLVAPFVFRAEGYAGGHKYIVHSAATQADVGNTINITPLTDLVLSNIAGQVAATYFDNPVNQAGLTAANLDAEAAKLRERLLPVLQAMGVEASIDLLRTPFTPLTSALDKAIDVLRVDYAAGQATITNVVTQQQIQDDLAVKAAQETAPATLTDTTGVADSKTDIDQIRAALLAFSNHFASGSPAVGVLKPALSPDFLFRDQGADDFLVNLTSFEPLVGVTFTDVTVDRIDYTDPQRPVAHVTFVMKGKTGTLISFERNWLMVKEGGKWLLHGDQATLDIEVVAMMHEGTSAVRQQGQLGTPTTCRGSGFSLIVEDYDTSNSASIAYVVVRGPGLPQDGVRADKPELGGYFTLPSRPNSGNFFSLTSTCDTANPTSDAAIAAIPAGAKYTVTAYTAQGAAVGAAGTYTVPLRPMTLAELKAASFPTAANLTFAQWANFNGGTLDVQVSGLPGPTLGLVEGFLGYSNNDSAEAEEEKSSNADGTLSATLTLPAAPNGASIWHRRLEVYGWDKDWREFTRFWNVSGI